jgi:hypothetical protein
MFAWASSYVTAGVGYIFGEGEEEEEEDDVRNAGGGHGMSPTKGKHSRVIPTVPQDTDSLRDTTLAGVDTTYNDKQVVYTGARSIVVAAALADFSDDDIDLLIEQHEAVSDEELSVLELEDRIMAKVDDAVPVSDMIEEQPHLEFDLAGMSRKELASVYREQVSDLFSLGSEVVGRKLDYSDIEALIGFSPPPPFDVDEDDDKNMSGAEYTVGEWGTFNASLRATLLLLAYQHSDLDTAGAILRLIRHIFRLNSDEDADYEDLDKFVEFATLAVYERGDDEGDKGDDYDDDDDEEDDDDDEEEEDEVEGGGELDLDTLEFSSDVDDATDSFGDEDIFADGDNDLMHSGDEKGGVVHAEDISNDSSAYENADSSEIKLID